MLYTRKQFHARLAANTLRYEETLKTFPPLMAETAAIADPAERYQQLAKVERDILAIKKEVLDEIKNEPERKNGPYGLAMKASALLFAGTFLLSLASMNPLMLITLPLIPGVSMMALGLIDTEWRYNNQKKAEENARGFLAVLEEHRSDISSKKAALLETSLPAIGASSHFDALYARHPEVKDAFVKAAAKGNMAGHITTLPAKPSMRAAA